MARLQPSLNIKKPFIECPNHSDKRLSFYKEKHMTPLMHLKSYEIHPFMVSQGERGLNLKGVQLLAYALIYQYCDEEYGRVISMTDFEYCCNCTGKAARDAIKELINKGYIVSKTRVGEDGSMERAYWLTRPKEYYEYIERKYKDEVL